MGEWVAGVSRWRLTTCVRCTSDAICCSQSPLKSSLPTDAIFCWHFHGKLAARSTTGTPADTTILVVVVVIAVVVAVVVVVVVVAVVMCALEREHWSF